MQFELHSVAMVRANRVHGKAGNVDLPESELALPAAPVITPVRSTQRIAEREWGFGDVAGHKIRILCGEFGPLQTLFGKKQSAAAVHQKARRLVHGDARGIRMMKA
ncbi:MAG: hypothetical protein ACK5VX_06895, partial [Akkermansiaceae bacterium]